MDVPRLRGGGDLFDLEFPSTLSAAERDEALTKLSGLGAELSQQLLDELSASMNKGSIIKTPLAYLRGLVKRARAGTFAPEGALLVAQQRRRKVENYAALNRHDVDSELPRAAIDSDNPLIKKILRIQQRAASSDGE